MTDVLATMEGLLAKLSPDKKAEVQRIAAAKLKQAWLPTPGPQTMAYLSKADVMLYGGAAGGGKTDLLLGTALTQHERIVFFRRAFVDLRDAEERMIQIVKTRDGYNGSDKILRRDGRILEFGALEKPNAEFSWQGRAHDLIVIDEAGQIPVDKVAFVIGWNRSVKPGQRCRVIFASNPPIGGEGDWMVDWFAPWLDPLFPNPAVPGELRWAIVVGVKTVWVAGSGQFFGDAQPWNGDKSVNKYTAMSRTFIPALLDDNPYLRDTDYRSRIENMREPLRTQLLTGDFMAGREDHEWQVIPTSWVLAAQARWKAAPARHRTMAVLAADIALGGGDKVIGAPLYEDNWFGELEEMPLATDEPYEIALWMLKHRRNEATLVVDATGGWGSGVMSHLKVNHSIECRGLVFSQGTKARSKDGKHTFLNLRAQMYWQFYEALSPDSADYVMLPPDPVLLAQLTAPRYTVRGTNVVVEDKDDIRKRIGSSPDRADAVVMAYFMNSLPRIRKAGVVSGLPMPRPMPQMPPGITDGWML